MKAIMSRGPILFTGGAVLWPQPALPDASVLVADGRIAPGYDADLVVFDEDWSVRATMISGELVFNELPEGR